MFCPVRARVTKMALPILIFITFEAKCSTKLSRSENVVSRLWYTNVNIYTFRWFSGFRVLAMCVFRKFWSDFWLFIWLVWFKIHRLINFITHHQSIKLFKISPQWVLERVYCCSGWVLCYATTPIKKAKWGAYKTGEDPWRRCNQVIANSSSEVVFFNSHHVILAGFFISASSQPMLIDVGPSTVRYL